MRRQESISLRLPPSWIELLDQRRGGLPRTVYIRRLLQKSLQVPAVKDLRGQYDRLAAGIMCPSSVEKELKRRADVEKRRLAKREAKKRPKPLPPPPVFVFHDNGIVGSPDLDVQATFCGVVREDGKYEPETTRHSESVIRQAVRKALGTGLLSGERWVRFVARGER